MAYKMGVKTHLSSYPAEALGGLTLGVTPLEMADVYATLADGGWRNTPIAITKVVFPDGHVDNNWGKPHRVKVLSEGVDRRGDERSSTTTSSAAPPRARRSTAPRPPRRARPANLIDAWLDGYNSEYSTVVWMGYPNKRVAMTDVHGEPQQGGYLPAEIWHAYMAASPKASPARRSTNPAPASPTRPSTANTPRPAWLRRKTEADRRNENGGKPKEEERRPARASR